MTAKKTTTTPTELPEELAAIIAAPIPTTLDALDAQLRAVDTARSDRALSPAAFGALTDKSEQLRFHRGRIESDERTRAAEESRKKRRGAYAHGYDAKIRPLANESAALVASLTEAYEVFVRGFDRLLMVNEEASREWRELEHLYHPDDAADRPPPQKIEYREHSTPKPWPKGCLTVFRHPADLAVTLRAALVAEVFAGRPQAIPRLINQAYPLHYD